MKKLICSLLLSIFLVSCFSTTKQEFSTKEKIFADIFTIDPDNNSGLSNLNKLKFYQGYFPVKKNDAVKLRKFNAMLLIDIDKTYPKFFDSFNEKISSGNPYKIEEALIEGSNIIASIFLKDSTKLNSYINTKSKLNYNDKLLVKKLHSNTDYRQSVDLVREAKAKGLFKRTLHLDMRLGVESMRMPNETNRYLQPDINYPYKDMKPTENFALNKDVAIYQDFAIALEFYIAVAVAIFIPYSDSYGKLLLKEKIINEIALKYKK